MAMRFATASNTPPARRVLAHSALACGLWLALAGDALAFRVDWALELVAERNDNVLLTPDDEIALTTLRPSLGFSMHHDTSRLQLEIGGRADHRSYGDERVQDTTDGSLDARMNWVLVPERLSFSVVDRLSLQPVDSLGADTPGNRQQVNVLAAGPSLRFEISPTWRGQADLRYIRSDAEISDTFDSRRVEFGLRALKRFGATDLLSLNAQAQRVDFVQDAFARDYRRSALFVRYERELSQTEFYLDAGYSRLDYNRALPGFASGRRDPLLRVEGAWRPNASHRLGLTYSREFSDLTNDTLAPGAASEDNSPALPPPVTTGETVVNASPYLEHRLEANYRYSGTRWTVDTTPYLDRLRYSDTDTFDQNGYGAGIEALWRARRTLSFGLNAALDHNRYLRLGRDDETRRFSVFARYDWARRWGARLEVGHYQRRSSASGQDAEQTVVLLGVTYRNR